MTRLRDMGVQMAISLVLALVLWATVTTITNPEGTRRYENVAVGARNVPSGLVIVNEAGLPIADPSSLEDIDVVVSTDQETLSEFQKEDIQAYVSLVEAEPGVRTADVQFEDGQPAVRYQPTPEEISVQLEEVITRTVPITVELVGSLPFSYERDEPETRVGDQLVQEAQVSGPSSQVERVVRAATTINIEQLRATYVSLQQLTPQDVNGDGVEGVTLDPAQVRVRVEISAVVGVKRVPVLGSVEGSPAPGYVVTQITSDPPLINLIGSSRVLNATDKVETEPINISNAAGTVTQTVAINFGNAQPQPGEPREATVTVQIDSLDQPLQVQIPAPVEVTGSPEGFLTSVTPPVIQVPLEGSVLAFVQLNAGALSANISAAGLGPGVYTLTPQVTVPPEFRIVGPLPEVTLTLSAPATPTAPPLPPTPTQLPVPDELPTATPPPTPEVPPTATPPPAPEDAPATEPGAGAQEEPSPTPTPPPEDSATLPTPPTRIHQGVA
jgi:YbbR domain-containing protein